MYMYICVCMFQFFFLSFARFLFCVCALHFLPIQKLDWSTFARIFQKGKTKSLSQVSASIKSLFTHKNHASQVKLKYTYLAYTHALLKAFQK